MKTSKKVTTPAKNVAVKIKKRQKGTSADSFNWDSLKSEGDKWNKSDKYYDKALAGIIYLGISTGLRISDILKLKKSDIQKPSIETKDHSYIEIVTKKTGKKVIKPLPHFFMDWMSDWQMVNKRDEIFYSHRTGELITSHFVNKRFKEIGKKFKAEGFKKNLSSHSLRKTFGVKMYNKFGVVEACNSLGHTTTKWTLEYLSVDEQKAFDNHIEIFE